MRQLLPLLLIAFTAAATPAAAVDRAPRAAKEAAKTRAERHFGGEVKATFTLRSQRNRRWSLITGEYRRKRLWAAWVRGSTVKIFRTRNFDPGRPAPCDIRPAFSEPACASATARDGRPTLHVGSSQRAIEAAQGSGCFSGPNGVTCADTTEVTTRKRLYVRRGHLVAFDFSRAMDIVEIGDGFQPDRTGGGRRWTAKVPDSLPDGLHRLEVFAGFDGGDQTFGVSLHVIRRPAGTTVRVPKVTGLAYGNATRELERRGLRWRKTAKGETAFDSGPPHPPNLSVSPDPFRDQVKRQSIRPGTRVRRRAVIVLETRCTLSARRGRPCL